MKFINNILVMSILLFFIGCTAWPALIPPPPGKKKTTIYPIPLPATSTGTVSVSITDSAGTALPTSDPIKRIAFNSSFTLKAFNGTSELTSGVTWTVTATDGTSATTLATIVATTGVLTASSTAGTVTVKATHSGGSSASVNVGIAATGNSIIAFDGKEFLEITTNQIKEEN